MMDHELRNALRERVGGLRLSGPDDPVPLVDVEAFFDGNDDVGSLGCNLVRHPGMTKFNAVLTRLRSRSDVGDVLVGIFDVEDDDSWPFSEKVYVVTSLELAALEPLVDALEVSEIDRIDLSEVTPEPAVPPGFHVFGLWWD